jgi:hypothetical protein
MLAPTTIAEDCGSAIRSFPLKSVPSPVARAGRKYMRMQRRFTAVSGLIAMSVVNRIVYFG